MLYLEPLRVQFETHANPVYAAGAKAYMKNKSEFYGLGATLRREIQQEFLRQNGLPNPASLEELMEYSWEQPQREWQYIGMEIINKFAAKGGENLLKMSEYMISHKSWWDTVDYIAPNIAGSVLKRKPELIPGWTEKWMGSDNLWLQRSCLIFQLKYREKTDAGLLFEFCERLADHKDFFIRKAIGWSLREYSKRNPEAVLEFVNSHKLSGLSYREATRKINI